MPFRDLSTYTEPDEEVQDRVLFILDNVSNSNLEAKLEFLKEHLREEHHQWFASYLVVERAKHEHNYHKLYLDVLDKYNDKGLTAEVLHETYVNVIKLLNAEPTFNSSNEGAHLKNLACIQGTRDWPAEKEEEGLPVVEDLSLHPQDFSPTSDPVPAGFADQVIVSSVVQHPAIKRILQLAMDRTIMEIIGSVVERSATIASISTSQLIQKGFATEGDEGKMRNAAHIVVRYLAGGLALVTCKDPLRMSMHNNIRALLAKSGYNEQVITDQTITVCVNDNIDIACQIIEKAIQERAIPDIDDGLNQAYQPKKPHRELRTNRPFVSPDVSQVALHVSDQLRLKPGGLSRQQLSMYEDFNRMARVPNLESARNSFESPFPSDFWPSGSTVVEPPQAQQRAYQQSPGVSDAG
ncbi:hypothetical protein B9Z19DRAFT_1067465 [Tuber borchii]|uniref:CCR4-NOT transcription complex subunit 1 domain-containing protein n=1 Tax=Tuber borchii TaxID=42251 RepID=A0A2T6ZIR0_TUBBO|nr:hypothetical protein B9Z19DRAFT_1067465 [Tuber borchii]